MQLNTTLSHVSGTLNCVARIMNAKGQKIHAAQCSPEKHNYVVHNNYYYNMVVVELASKIPVIDHDV